MPEPRRKPVVGPETRAPIKEAGPERGNRFAMGAHIRILHDQVKVAEIMGPTVGGARNRRWPGGVCN